MLLGTVHYFYRGGGAVATSKTPHKNTWPPFVETKIVMTPPPPPFGIYKKVMTPLHMPLSWSYLTTILIELLRFDEQMEVLRAPGGVRVNTPDQWRSQGLLRWASRPPGGPIWERKLRKIEGKWEKMIEGWRKMRKCSSFVHKRLRVWLRPCPWQGPEPPEAHGF